MTGPVRVAVIGCGSMGMHHIRALKGIDGASCAAVFDADVRRAQAAGEQAGPGARVVASLAEAAVRADVAVVATPNAMHAAQVGELLDRGLHVLCEKPLCLTSAEARELYSRASAQGRVLACGHARRFYPAVELLREALVANVVGRVSRCTVSESGYGWPFSKWHFDAAASRGVLFDTGPHVVDLLLHLFGDLELLDCRDDAEGGMAAEVWMRLRGHMKGEPLDIHVHMGRSFPIRSGWQIEGNRGALSLDLQHIDRIGLALGGGLSPFSAVSQRDGHVDPFRRQLENFIDAVLGRAPLRVPPPDVVRGLELLELATRGPRKFQDSWTQALPGPRIAPRGKILLTGACGRIGSRLVELWAASGRLGELRAVVRSYEHAARIMRFPIEIVEADLLDPRATQRAFSGCTEVIHLASGSHPDRETRSVAELALAAGVSRFIHMSSASIYGPSLPASLDETQEDTQTWATGDAYADGKAAAEDVVRALARRGLSAIILRPHLVYGPGISWSEKAMQLLLAGRLRVLEGGGWANLIYVDDLIAAVDLARASSLRGAEAFFVTDGTPLRWSEYIDAHAALLGLDAVPRVRSAEVIAPTRRGLRQWLRASVRPIGPLVHSREFRAFIMDSPLMRSTVYRALVAARELPPFRRPMEGLRGEGLPVSQEPLCDPVWARLQISAARLSNERLRHALGFEPRVTFEDGLRRTVPWFEAFDLLPGGAGRRIS